MVLGLQLSLKLHVVLESGGSGSDGLLISWSATALVVMCVCVDCCKVSYHAFLTFDSCCLGAWSIFLHNSFYCFGSKFLVLWLHMSDRILKMKYYCTVFHQTCTGFLVFSGKISEF